MKKIYKLMNKTYTRFLVLFVLVISVLIFKDLVLAQNVSYKIPNPSNIGSLEELINLGASLIRPLFVITFGAMILYGAFLLLSSQGDAEKVANSRKTIIAAIIGFVIAVFAPTILNLVTSLVGVEGLSVL
jgi:hypothetical protein